MKIKKDASITGMSGQLITTSLLKKSIEELDAILHQLKLQVDNANVNIDGGSARNVGSLTNKIDGGGANG